MSCDLLRKWLAHYDPIHRGFTPAGIANGVTATCGWAFPRVRGGYNLYRGAGASEAIDFAYPVGAAGRDASTISNFDWQPHAASTVYAYVVRSIGGGGVESEASGPARVAAFDEGGELIGLRSNSPVGLTVRPIAGGRFVVRWAYDDRGQETAPDHFALFRDDGSGTVDFESVVGTVPYRRGRAHYAFTSESFDHDTRRLWSVRAVTSEGVDDGNVQAVLAVADAQAPNAHPSVRAVCMESEE